MNECVCVGFPIIATSCFSVHEEIHMFALGGGCSTWFLWVNI